MCTKKEDAACFHVKNFIMKRGAFKEDQTLHMGFSNHCCKRDDTFHLFLDCDDTKLSKVFDGIESLRKKFKELSREKFLILNTSLNRFSLACFANLTWKRYLEMLYFAVHIGIAHDGYAFYSENKGYGVLRVGAKYGIVPTILYSVGTNVCCKKCLRTFTTTISEIPSY